MYTSIRRNFFFILVAIVTVSFFLLLGNLIFACFWAAVLAVIFHGTFRRLRISLQGRSNLAALLTTLLILLFVLLPLTFLSINLVNQTIDLITRVQAGEINVNAGIDFIEQQLPLVEEYLGRLGVETDRLRENISNFAINVGQTIANRALTITTNILAFIVQFVLMLYLLFFFLRDGHLIMNAIINALPMGNRREWMLFQRFAVVARATLKGTLIVAFIQGAIGGLLFWIMGIPAPILWGFVMMVLSLLPVGGSGLVWLPAAVIFAVQGVWLKAIIIVIVGAAFIGLVDNLLRPILVGRESRMPDYLVLLATLGGIAWFGLSGFVLGPVLAALFLTVWEMVGNEFGGKEA